VCLSGVEDGVDDRVEKAVDVAEPRDEAQLCIQRDGRVGEEREPRDEADDGRRHGAMTQRAAERTNRRQAEERQPADDEQTHGYLPRRCQTHGYLPG